MRSSSGSPDAWYFLAIDTTRRRFDCTNWRSASSPWRAVPAQLALARRRDVLAAGVEHLDRLLARLDRLGETDLVVLGEQRVLPDVGQVETNEVFVIAINAIFGHGGSFVPSPRGGVVGARHPLPAGNVLTIPTRSRPPTREPLFRRPGPSRFAMRSGTQHRPGRWRCRPRRRAVGGRREGEDGRENRQRGIHSPSAPGVEFPSVQRGHALIRRELAGAQSDPQREELRGGSCRLGCADGAEPRWQRLAGTRSADGTRRSATAR